LLITIPPGVAGRRRRHPSWPPRLGRRWWDGRTRRDFLVTQFPAPVTDFQLAVFPFADQLALSRRISALPLHLEESVPMSHHPVVADDVPGLQEKNQLDKLG
jgi:hypothetical protein